MAAMVRCLRLSEAFRNGNVIPTGAERANQAEERVEQAEERATEAEQKAQKFAERLRAMGIDPDEV